MEALERLEVGPQESHDGDIGHNGLIGRKAKQGLVVQLVRTRRSHRRGHRFESCQDHKKTLPGNWGSFLFKSARCCENIAIRIAEAQLSRNRGLFWILQSR